MTNLNFFIDDHVHARALLTGLGSPIHLDGPSSAAPALADYGPGNTRPGADERPFMFIGTRHLIGLDLEMMEQNFLRFVDQAVQYPAYVRPRPKAGDGNLLLQRLRIVVDDLEQVHANLVKIFTPGCCSKRYARREGTEGRAFRVGLGGMEIEYCQPTGASGPLLSKLERYGPGVVTIEFGARDPVAVLDRCLGRADVSEEPDWLGVGDTAIRRQLIASRECIGFDTALGAI